MTEIIVEIFSLAIIFGPAVICIVMASRSEGEWPSPDTMLAGLVWTTIMLGLEWAHYDKASAELKRTCRQLEHSLTLTHHDANYEAADDLPGACLLSLGYEDPPDPDEG